VTQFEDLVCKEIPRLRRYARSLTRNSADADDVMQGALARALAKDDLWAPGTDIGAWLRAIVHNQWINEVRGRALHRHDVPFDNDVLHLSARVRSDDSIGSNELELALSLIPQHQQIVLILVGLEGLTYEQVAETIGIDVGTVRSRLSRGRALLEMLLDGTTKGEPGHDPKKTLRSIATRVNAARRRAGSL